MVKTKQKSASGVSSKEKKLLNPHTFERAMQGFIFRAESLKSAFPVVMASISDYSKKENSRIDEFIIANSLKRKTVKVQKRKIYTIKITPDLIDIFRKLIRKGNAASHSRKTLAQSLFIALVSDFDIFISNALHAVYVSKPELINAVGKNITITELLTFNDIAEAKAAILEKEVDSFLRENHSDHFEWFEKRLGIAIKSDTDLWTKFIEITERRNLFVHADGIVNDQYLKNCTKESINLPPNIVKGSRLSVSDEYFIDSVYVLVELAIKLSQVLWRKLLPHDIENADDNINDFTYDLLQSGDYRFAEKILNFTKNDKFKCAQDQQRLIFAVNRSLAVKFQGRDKEARELMSKEDWSGKHPNFQLANAVICEDETSALRLMKEIGNKEEIDNAYKDWPLFKDFRKNPKFLSQYKKLFNKDFIFDEKNERNA